MGTGTKNCGQLYRKISNDYFVIMDDEKYFSLSNVNMPGNAYYYTSDRHYSTTRHQVQQEVKI